MVLTSVPHRRGVAQVSSLGRYRDVHGIVKTPKQSKSGYRAIRLAKKKYLLHRVVAFTFKLPREFGQITVNHKNGDRGDNSLKNLEFMTMAQQIAHAHATNAKRKSNGPKQSKPLYGRKVGSEDAWTWYGSLHAAASALGVDPGSVSKCCNEKCKKTGGYEFKYAECDEGDEGEWRIVEGSTAQVSSLGLFRSTRGVVTRPTPDASGYVRVQIDGRRLFMHRLVAAAFLAPVPGKNEVNHLDCDPGNNRVDNLEYVTPSENVRHSYDTNTDRESNSKQRSKPVNGRKVGTTVWTLYANQGAAANALGLSAKSVRRSCNDLEGKVQPCGYEFEYADPDEPTMKPGEVWLDVVLK